MALLGPVIAAFCVGTVPGTYNKACNHAMDAGTRQVGVRQEVDNAESGSIRMVSLYAQKTLGKETMAALGAGGYIYRVVREKSASFKLPTFGLCNSVSNQVTPNSYKLTLEWKLR